MCIRLAARAVIVENGRLLLVNAYPGAQSDLWCCPGGGVAHHTSLRETLVREVHEETGLTVEVGAPCLVNEFHDPGGDFHQVEVFFRCAITGGALDDAWRDPENIVTRRRFVTREGMQHLRVKPDSLPRAAFGEAAVYDPLEPIVR
ncbi:NUDIX domain-containing protein [Roseovarius salinarum]|uniref:NUDIX domain-containing protein n=1 Tax=Roseovarius salinarum TaxID=1981892 RepID=UPI000C343C74|nr:NUDIX domain-containing protein [Roseovarius salinarum]